MNVGAPLDQVKGVGEKTGAQFEAAGIHTVNDLITFLPRAYEDFSHVTSIADVRPGKQTIKVVDTGHALFSGPNPDQMRLIYNTFMLRLLQNYDYVTSSVQNIREINVHKGTKMSNDEWLALRKEELQYTLDLTSGKLPMYEKEFTSEKYVVWADKLPVFGYRSMSWEDNFNDTESESESESESED